MIQIIKLITGEKLISFCRLNYIEEVDEHSVTLHKPFTIKKISDNKYVLNQFIAESDSDDIIISPDHVLYSVEPSEQFLTMYNEITGMKNVVDFNLTIAKSQE